MTWPGFTRPRASVALATGVHRQLGVHLARRDGQEDLCFVLWRPSLGSARASALIGELVLPETGERFVHGTASFTDAYFLRAAEIAATHGCGLGLIHAHPRARGWQALSPDDHEAEAGHAARTEVLTGFPLLGLTYATGNARYSARFWHRTAPRQYEPWWCETVRIVGDQYQATYHPTLRPFAGTDDRSTRTVTAWGPELHADLARIRVGVIGTGSIGDLVGEGLARTGIQHILGMDFDTVDLHNLDRLLHADLDDAHHHRPKIEPFVHGLRRASTALDPHIEGSRWSVCEPEGWAQALDYDVLFSCVDRPWPRAVLNLIAYAHLIPVIDGGVLVDAGHGHMRDATWRAHIAAPGRRCLECLGQYDPAHVALERAGYLDDPTYIHNLPNDSPLRGRNQNVYAFAAAAAAAELNQFLTMVIAPGGLADHGAHHTRLKTGTTDLDTRNCEPGCLYTHHLLAQGDHTAITVTGVHCSAQRARNTESEPA